MSSHTVVIKSIRLKSTQKFSLLSSLCCSPVQFVTHLFCVLYDFIHDTLSIPTDELAKIIMSEHGKIYGEAVGDLQKGNETVEWSTSLPQLAQGKIEE